jgi:hypothetical protein
MNRKTALENLLNFKLPIEQAISYLSQFEWDSEVELVSLVQGGRLAKNSSNLPRETVFFRTVLPWTSVPCKLNVFLAKSIPIVVRFMSDSPLKNN